MAKPLDEGVDQNIKTTVSLLNDVVGAFGLPNVAVRLWDGTIWRPEPDSPVRCTLVLQHPGALRKMCLPPTPLRFGEAYIGNDFDIEGDAEALVPLTEIFLKQRLGTMEQLRLGARLLSLPNTGASRRASVAAKMLGRLHSRARDRQAVTYHYEQICNDFFALWLDPRLVYSCAYFATPAGDLETAQRDKLDYVCRKLRLKRGERLLDIGCGWGALVIHAAQHYGVEAHGVTLSTQQAELARERIKRAGLEESCRVDICDYRDVSTAQKYDKLVSVGFAEHVGEALLTTYFKCAWELLRPGGVLLNHAIGVHSATPLPGLDFVQRYLFPDAEAVPLSTTLRAAESVGFGICDVENLKEHYAHTARHWLRRLEENSDAARRLGGEITYRSLRLVFLASLREFASGSLHLYQSLLVKLNNGRTGLPLRRADWYA